MDPLPPLPDGAKMLTAAPALPPLPQGATMLTDHKAPKTPIDTGPDMTPPSTGEQIVRGAYSPIDAILTLLEHQFGSSAGAVARLGAQASNDVIGTHIDPTAVHDSVANALGANNQPVTSEGQSDLSAVGNAVRAVRGAIDSSTPGKAVNDTLSQIATKYPNVAAKLKQMGVGASDVMNTVGLAAGGEGSLLARDATAPTAGLGAETARGLPPRPSTGELPPAPITDPIEQLKTAGYKIPETQADVAAARENNPQVTAELAKRAAGMTSDQQLTTATLADAKKPHNAVYNQAFDSLPDAVPAASDPQFTSDVNAAGSTPSTLTPKTDAIDKLKTKALANDTLTPEQLQANISEMRTSGYKNLDSADDDTVALGRTQLDMAKAHEGLLDRNLPDDGPVSLTDVQNARVGLAKINMIQRNMVGEDVNPAGIAREARGNPAVNGELRLIANLNDLAPKGAGLPQRAPLPGSALTHIGLGLAGGAGIGGHIGGMLGGGIGALVHVPEVISGIRRLMAGAPNVPADLSQAGLGDMFTRGNGLEPGWNRAPVEPQIAGLLPAPSTVNAGGGAATENQLQDLGLSSDVQRAAAQHPGAARSVPVPEPPTTPGQPPVDFQGPQHWGDLSLAPDQSGHTPAVVQGQGPSLADLLAHGVEQAPHPGLALETPHMALARRAQLPPDFAPSEAGRLSGGLSLADEVANGAVPQSNSDLGSVMSQGVPEGIMSRTAKPGPAPDMQGPTTPGEAAGTAIPGGSMVSPHDQAVLDEIQKFFHGGANNVTAFDKAKRGTGEGNASFGVGDYHAGAEDAAASYIPSKGGYLMETGVKKSDVAKMLDWDKPLSDQPAVLKALGVDPDAPVKLNGINPEWSGQELHDALVNGKTNLGVGQDKQAIADFLESKGIPGIKYLDGMSRKAGKGSQNVVTFNPDLATVISSRKVGG